MKMNLLISFSGGRTSAYMTYLLMMNRASFNEVRVAFANTGKEREETLRFVDQCDKHFGWGVTWVEAVVTPKRGVGTTHRVVSFESASRNGEPFESIIIKYGLPNKSYPHCTRELKEQPIKSLVKSLGWLDYKMAIGIRTDEMDRINFERADRARIIYPLATTFPTTKSMVNEFWKGQPFDLKLQEHQGNCDCCWKKSFNKLHLIANESPELFDWWNRMEQKYQYHNPRGDAPRKPFRMYRQNTSASEFNGCEGSCEAFN